MLPVHRAGRRADAGSLLYAKDFPAGARADPYSGGARRRVPAAPATARLVQVLFDELPRQPQEHLQLPVSNHPKIRQMVTMMAEDPARWQTLSQWAAVFAMSERNLARR